MLAREAVHAALVHAALAGRTGVMIGTIHNRAVHVPIELATETRKKGDLGGEMWKSVVGVTGQPVFRALDT